MTASLVDVLQELQVSNGLDMAAIVSADGLVVDAAARSEIDVESICSVASNGALMMDALGQELDEAAPEMLTIEYQRHIVVMAPLIEDHLLIMLAGAGTNLGKMRIVLRRRMDVLTEALENV